MEMSRRLAFLLSYKIGPASYTTSKASDMMEGQRNTVGTNTNTWSFDCVVGLSQTEGKQ